MAETQSQAIYRLISNKYERMGYSVLPQVRNKPGTDDIRTADALAISQSALRDTSFIGFEIKVSKSDFRTELANPQKADEIAQFCNKWYVVAPRGVIPVKELPENWGLLEATKTQLRITKKAIDLPCVPPTREFVAMIVRKVENDKSLEKEYWRGFQEGKEQESGWRKDSQNRRDERLKTLEEAMKEFYKHTGINIIYWDKEDAKKIGKIVALIRQGGITQDIKRMEERASQILELLKDALQELEANPLPTFEKEAP